jgi:tetratricopeptide (TPR) repeat protein
MLAEDLAHARAAALRGLPFANALRAQALVDRTLGRYDAAQHELEEAFAAWNATGGAEVHPSAGNAFVLDRAGLQIARGDAAAALVTLKAVATPRDVAVMPLAVDETAARILSSQALLMQGRADDARAAAQQALDWVVTSSVREYFPLLEADASLRLGQAQQRLGDLTQARASLERAVGLRTANDDPQASPWLAEADAALAACLAALGERPAALALSQAAARIDANHPRLGAHLREPVARLALAR